MPVYPQRGRYICSRDSNRPIPKKGDKGEQVLNFELNSKLKTQDSLPTLASLLPLFLNIFYILSIPLQHRSLYPLRLLPFRISLKPGNDLRRGQAFNRCL